MDNFLPLALELAAEYHYDQADKAGKPYVLHLLRVMFNLNTDDEELMSIAILHDILEDTIMDRNSLSKYAFSGRIIDGVESVTKRNSETYQKYLERVALNPDAILVKLADLKDNMDLSRLPKLTETDLKRQEKYSKARAFLVKSATELGIKVKPERPSIRHIKEGNT